MKKEYNAPAAELVVLHTEDIITQSGEGDPFYDSEEKEYVHDVGGWFN